MSHRQPDPAPGAQPERGLILAVLGQGLDAEEELEELRELARTAGVEPVAELVQHRGQPDRRSYVGKGKLDELREAYGRAEAEVLLVDDNPTQLRARAAVLREAGFSVRTASTADAAFDLLRDPAFTAGLRVIVTDHVMPGVGGAVFVRELRRASSVPVVVVSGLVEAEEEYAGLEVHFLPKPCLPEDLIHQVRDALQKNARSA